MWPEILRSAGQLFICLLLSPHPSLRKAPYNGTLGETPHEVDFGTFETQ